MLFNTESMQQNKDPSRNLLIKHKLGKWKAEWRCKTWRSENTCTNIPTRASLAISNQLNKIQSKKFDHFWYLNFPVCCMVSTSAPRKELWQALTGSNSQNGEQLQSNPQELCITLHNKSWEHDASAFLLGGSVNMNQLWMCDWEMFIFFFGRKTYHHHGTIWVPTMEKGRTCNKLHISEKPMPLYKGAFASAVTQ